MRAVPKVKYNNSHNIKWVTGLRALSFSFVFLYHLTPKLMPNGFLGVDIFFVISGFVISKIITEKWNKQFFGNFLPFYYSRLRRIVPSLFAVLTCISLGLIYNPSRKIVANYRDPVDWIIASVSNIFYWTRTNYFTDDQSLQPWIHTWSLGVEEQFYLLFPAVFIAMLFLATLSRQRVLFTGVFVGILVTTFIERTHPTSVFYLLPFRFWEFLVGCLAWEISRKQNSVPTRRLSIFRMFSEVLAGIALLLLNLDTLRISNNLVLEVLLCTAVFTLLVKWRESGPLKQLLELRPLIWCGIISYQLYLWHQPIIVWLKSAKEMSNIYSFYIFATLLTFIAAVLTRRFVRLFEREYSVRQSLRLTSLLLMWAIVIFGINRVPIHANTFESAKYIQQITQAEIDNAYRTGTCFLPARSKSDYARSCFPKSSNQTLIWGDSHAAALSSGFALLRTTIRQQTYGSCAPLLVSNKDADCLRNNLRIFSEINDSVTDIILSADWRQYWNADFKSKIVLTIEQLKNKYPSKQITLFGQAPLWEPRPLLLQAPAELSGSKVVYVYNSNIASTNLMNQRMAEVARLTGVQFIDIPRSLCEQKSNSCIALLRAGNRYQASSNDGSHLNPIAARYLIQSSGWNSLNQK
jgi:peptidoglycan/LPS O-acetylase OafA/YrhL